MIWYEVIKAKKEVTVKVTTFYFNEFSEKRCLEFYANMTDALKQLKDLGNDLTIDDYDKIKALQDKLDINGSAYRSMRYMEGQEKGKLSHFDRFFSGEDNEKRILNEKLRDIDDGIRNYDSTPF